jgi:hypothetical protein
MANTSVANTPGLDPVLPDVILRLGGVDRHLVFDFNAIVQAEKASGLNLLKAMFSDMTAEHLRGLLWAAMLRETPTITIDEVGSMITFLNMGEIHAAIVAAWMASVRDADKDDPPSPKRKAQAKRKRA